MEALQIAVKRREAKSKGEKERHKNLNAEFQRMARRDKKALLTQRGNATIKRTPQTARIQKGHPKLSNLNKMKRQMNTQQIKEQDK